MKKSEKAHKEVITLLCKICDTPLVPGVLIRKYCNDCRIVKVDRTSRSTANRQSQGKTPLEFRQTYERFNKELHKTSLNPKIRQDVIRLLYNVRTKEAAQKRLLIKFNRAQAEYKAYTCAIEALKKAQETTTDTIRVMTEAEQKAALDLVNEDCFIIRDDLKVINEVFDLDLADQDVYD